jgi:charged multivesicular body protein 2A
MNRQMNLPGLAKIAMEFERENDIMEQRQEMMDDAIDDAMDVGAEEEGEEVVEQVLEEIGVDLTQAVCSVGFHVHVLVNSNIFAVQLGETPSGLQATAVSEGKVAQAVGEEDDLQARLDSLRR